MRLLTPSENKTSKDEQTLRTIIRTQELQKVEQEYRQKLANAEADFNLTLARNRDLWASEEEEHLKRLQEMNQEINLLETKRLNFLIPFNILQDGTLDRMEDAESYLSQLREKEEYNEDLTEKLQDKLDQVNGKEQDLNRKELELNIRETGLENQSNSTVTATKLLNTQIQEFITSRNEVEKDLEERKNAISLLEQSLNERELELNQVQKLNNEQAIKLADERGVLKRAWDELAKKKIR